MFNLGRGDIHETRSIGAHIQSRCVSDNFAPLMPDRKSVAQHGNFRGKAGKGSHCQRHQDGKPPK
jgi:hypothetical protein